MQNLMMLALLRAGVLVLLLVVVADRVGVLLSRLLLSLWCYGLPCTFFVSFQWFRVFGV